MPLPTISDAEFIKLFEKLKSPSAVARELGIKERAVYARRNRLEDRHAILLQTNNGFNKGIDRDNFRATLKDVVGKVIVFSDAHIWPNERSTIYEAMLLLIQELKPKAIICNGDLFDGATISRFGRSGLFDSSTPDMIEELHCAQDMMAEIESIAPNDCNLIFTAGNHDVRFTTRIAQNLPDFRNLNGFQFHHYFPSWVWAWSCIINPDTYGETWVKHRWHNGPTTAGYNNVLKSGCVNFVTGHTHALEVRPYVNVKGRRYYGVQTGTLSPIGNKTQKFGYAEDNPSQSSCGFVVLTYDSSSRLLPPELVEVVEGDVIFRGEVVLYGDGDIKGRAKIKNINKAPKIPTKPQKIKATKGKTRKTNGNKRKSLKYKRRRSNKRGR